MINKSYALKTYAILELLLGMVFILDRAETSGLYISLTEFIPLAGWGVMFILLSLVAMATDKLYVYVFAVSVPFFILAAKAYEAYLLHGNISLAATVVYLTIAISSAAIAGKIDKKDADI